MKFNESLLEIRQVIAIIHSFHGKRGERGSVTKYMKKEGWGVLLYEEEKDKMDCGLSCDWESA